MDRNSDLDVDEVARAEFRSSQRDSIVVADDSVLSRIENPNENNDYAVRYMGEVVHDCPLASAKPERQERQWDKAEVDVEYRPNDYIVDYDTFGEYLDTYRNGTFVQEEVLNQVYDDLKALLFPKVKDPPLHVELSYDQRNGISPTLRVGRM